MPELRELHLWRMRTTILLILGLGWLLVACGPTPSQGAPADLLINYNWREGTVPPPYHYQYSIRIQADGQGEITMIPGYSAEAAPTWSEPFRLSQTELAALYATLLANDLHREAWRSEELPPIGGSSEDLRVVAEGRSSEIPPFPLATQQARAQVIMEAVRASVPPAIFADLLQRREEFMAAQGG